MKKNPFTGQRFFECSITGPKYGGYILSDVSVGGFVTIANDYARKAKKFSVAELAGIIRKHGRRAEVINPMEVDFVELKKGKTSVSAQHGALERYFVYSVVVDGKEQLGEHALDWQGLLATDAGAKEFQEMMLRFARNHVSRSRGDIAAYLEGHGHYACWLNGKLVFLKVKA